MHDTEHSTTTPMSPPNLSPEQVAAMTPAQVSDSLKRALGAAFQHLTISRQQRRQHVFAMTLDEFAGCTRQAAYRIAATPPTDPSRVLSGQHRLTNLHHAVSQTLLPALGHVLGAQHHMPVTLSAAGLELPGTVPLYWPTTAVLGYVVTTPAPADHPGLNHLTAQWQQVQQPRARQNAAALALAALQARLPVAWMAEVNISRATGDSRIGLEAMTEAHETAVQRRAAELATHAEDPDNAPCDERDPTGWASSACGRCPWLGRCWPDHPRTTNA